MDKLLFNRQFLLSKENPLKINGWKTSPIGPYTLFSHPNLEVTRSIKNHIQTILIGYVFDGDNPSKGNQEILDELTENNSTLIEFIKSTDRITGQFVIIYLTATEFYLFNDACAQREVYYTEDCSCVASQICLLEQVQKFASNKSDAAKEFYSSEEFNKKRVFVGSETNKEAISHLRANHFLNLLSGEQVRFFPYKTRTEIPLKVAAEKAASMLHKFLEAVASRYKMALPVTAGYDSRVLFGSSIGIDCYYFVFKHRALDESHPDIQIPKKLLKKFNTELHILKYDDSVPEEFIETHQKSIDFFRKSNTAIVFNGYQEQLAGSIILNGNLSEIARNYYGNYKTVSADDLAFMLGVEKFSYAKNILKKWLDKNQPIFSQTDYRLLDMFYWEERMGNWAAKGKTEALLGAEFFSPFNSRALIDLLLSVNPKYRDTHFNKLFDAILIEFSNKLLSEPINPMPKTKMIKMMKRFQVYEPYRVLGLKYRFLKFG